MEQLTIAEYVALKMKNHNIQHLFGVPATSCFQLYDAVIKQDGIDAIITTNELEAGYSADAYARFSGLSAVCVSYGVGTLSMMNAIAGAYVEKSPVIVINGGPSTRDLELEEQYGVLFSHSTGNAKSDYNLYKQIACAAEIIQDTTSAQTIIDNIFRAAEEALEPVYLEVPHDLWLKKIDINSEPKINRTLSNKNTIDELVQTTLHKLKNATKPAIMLGVEVYRRELQEELESIIDKLNIPFVSTLLSKGYISEENEYFIGTYDSDFAAPEVRDVVENSDCLISLGCRFGIDHGYMVRKQYGNMIDVAFSQARIGDKHYVNTPLKDFLIALDQAILNEQYSHPESKFHNFTTRTQAKQTTAGSNNLATNSTKLDYENMFAALQDNLSSEVVYAIDTSLASYPGADLFMHSGGFIANPVWLSIGFCGGAAPGIYFATNKRPVVVVGDGGYQMVCQSYSTLVKHSIPAVIIVVDNGLYAIEQYLIEPEYFKNDTSPPLEYNVLNRWRYHEFPQVFGGGVGIEVDSVEELRRALNLALDDSQPYIITLKMDPRTLPQENRRI